MLVSSNSSSASPDRVWSIMMSQLERATLPRETVPRQILERRYAVRLVQRGDQGAPRAEAAADAATAFDAMSCVLLACSCVARQVSMPRDDGQQQICFVTRQHAARVMARLGPVLASCNERLRGSPWEVTVTRLDVH
ncbi:hypothetical protein ACPWT1_08440 [Ramlibacter sp. MMS24-I3-19]|uniref:hypothetical protein n=1 Tax=Ramlibacter sp. MMS24-I3-19 TaxID=3416606 RepID=UPI003D063B4A